MREGPRTWDLGRFQRRSNEIVGAFPQYLVKGALGSPKFLQVLGPSLKLVKVRPAIRQTGRQGRGTLKLDNLNSAQEKSDLSPE